MPVGDVLMQVNGVKCSRLNVADNVTLLRSVSIGMNMLRFSLPATDAD